MSFLSFLKDGVQVTPNATKQPSSRGIERNPAAADIRIFSNGAAYPSASLVKRFGLEYTSVGGVVGNGFDVFYSKEFGNTAGDPNKFIMIASVAKDSAKVDLFATTRYDDKQDPISSIMSQGTPNPWLISLLETAYGIQIPKGEYIDLTLVKDEGLSAKLQSATNGIYYVPKAIARGAKKGEPSYVRRENLDIYVLAPQAALQTEDKLVALANSKTVNA